MLHAHALPCTSSPMDGDGLRLSDGGGSGGGGCGSRPPAHRATAVRVPRSVVRVVLVVVVLAGDLNHVGGGQQIVRAASASVSGVVIRSVPLGCCRCRRRRLLLFAPLPLHLLVPGVDAIANLLHVVDALPDGVAHLALVEPPMVRRVPQLAGAAKIARLAEWVEEHQGEPGEEVGFRHCVRRRR